MGDLTQLGMDIETLREHHASLGPVDGHDRQTADLIEQVHATFQSSREDLAPPMSPTSSTNSRSRPHEPR